MEKNDKRLVAKDVLRVFDDADKGQLVALHDFNLEADHGEIVALIGPSGCGKSTFLRLVAGLDQAQGGTIQAARTSRARRTTVVSCSRKPTCTRGSRWKRTSRSA